MAISRLNSRFRMLIRANRIVIKYKKQYLRDFQHVDSVFTLYVWSFSNLIVLKLQFEPIVSFYLYIQISIIS